ncbi:hypothetical protein [Demequina muriae]|uniref:Lipoprotein n=1 Tax=Demequina muriae TaxID=3051664 RepID=A0ABT8GG72_9MICO|nr:hypothetical protein [Demequina sp. EGI L300058]MDN4479941.1 hypothetical protein [Demequina sp. EGI L300058]
MNKNTMRAGGLAVLIAATGAFGLTACSSDAEGDAGTETEATEQTTVDVATDLENARAAVEEALAEDDSWTQVMLAGDVEAPTQKYGLLVMPFVASDAAESVTGTVNIDGGNYTIEAESAASGDTWQIDQDGEITPVTE